MFRTNTVGGFVVFTETFLVGWKLLNNVDKLNWLELNLIKVYSIFTVSKS